MDQTSVITFKMC